MPEKNVYYGFHSAEEAIRERPERINQIWVSTARHTPRLKQLISEARRKNIPVKFADKHALARLARDAHHQDIVLEVSPYSYRDANDLMANITRESLFCILDEIHDANNLAALIRTMEGARVQGIFLPERRSASVTATTQRLSAGALEYVPIARVTNLANLIEELQQKGVHVICSDSAATKEWHEADFTGPVAIVLGNEQKGVRRLLKEKSDDLVRIPMLGKIQSLNVTATGAILIYEAIRQRQSSTKARNARKEKK